MKFSLYRTVATGFVFIISATTMVNANSTCSEEAGICLCSGSCPSFTSGWATQVVSGSCLAQKSGDNILLQEDGGKDIVNVDGVNYTYPFDDTCPGSNSNGGDNSSNSGHIVGTSMVGCVVAAVFATI